MYINLTEDQLSTLMEALVDAQDDKLEEAKYTMDKEDKADLIAAAESFGELRQDLYRQIEAEREAGTNKIHVVLELNKDILLRSSDDTAELGRPSYELEDAINGELGWLHDSGMYVDSWSFAQENPIQKQQPSREPLVTEGVLKLPPEKVDMLNYCLTHDETEIADQYGAIGDDPQVWFDFTSDIEAILTVLILEGRSQLQLELMHKGEPYAEPMLMQRDTLDGSYTFTAHDGVTFTLTVEKDPEQQREGRTFIFQTDATDLPKTANYFNGKTCTVLEQVEPKLDYEPLAIGEMMWRVKFSDGATLNVYDDELQPIPRKKDLTAQIQGAEGKREQSTPASEGNQKER